LNYKLIYRIAMTLLLARWKQTLVAAIGVMFSITMFIALLGFMNGLNDMLDGLILNRTPHVRLYNEIRINPDQPINHSEEFKDAHNFVNSMKPASSRKEIYNSQQIIQAILQDSRVAGVAPKVSTQVFFTVGSVDIAGAIAGIDVEAESRLFHFDEYITAGSALDIKTISNSIILGKALAEKLIANVGDVIYITTPQGERFAVKVVGFFQSGIQEYDKVQSFASLSTTQKILGKDNAYVTDIQVKLEDLSLAPVVANEYRSQFSTETEDVQTANAQFETGSFIRSLISYAVGVTLLIVAGFGIYNILNMMIYEKMDSIAILKATGFSGTDVNRIFIFIALSIGVSGGISGLFFGFLISAAIDRIPFNTSALPTISTYPVNYDPIFYVIGLSFSLVTTFLAGLFPANKASRIDPVIIIRGK
jgi:lipoprotein-releasing system permease protein